MDICSEENVLEELLRLLKLEKIEENIFRGESQDLAFGNVFGGQVIGQALSAACRTIPSDFIAHSLHGYFMLHGDARAPIVYTVDCVRDGKTFSSRRVLALQKGKAIFSMSSSFQKEEEGLEHQDEMPNVVGPEGLESEVERAKKYAKYIPKRVLEKQICAKPIEIRVVNPVNPFDPKPMSPEKYVWFRAIDTLPDDPAVHRYMLAYASDFQLTTTSLYPHGKTYWSKGMQVASLDHSIWFLKDFRMDDWLLHVIKSPAASGGRGLCLGSIYTRDGRLVASTAQEGLMRQRKR